MDDTIMQLVGEKLYSATDLAKILDCSETKVRRLMTEGSAAIDGRTVCLQTILTESGRRTSVEAYRRFQVELNRREDSANQ